MIYSEISGDDLTVWEVFADLQTKVKQVILVESFGKQGFHYDTRELSEPIAKAVTDTSEKVLAETKSNTKASEELGESKIHVKAMKLVNKYGLIDSSLIRPIAKILVPRMK